MPPSRISQVVSGRSVTISGITPAGQAPLNYGLYRARPNGSVLVSAGLTTGSPSVVYPAEGFQFKLWCFYGANPNPADVNDDGIVDGSDYILFINAFSAMESLADLDNDGIIDGNDFVLFTNAFSAGC